MLSLNCTVGSTLEAARAHLRDLSPTASTQLVETVIGLVDDLFAGRHPGYQKADLKYHNLEHTLLATHCFIDLAAGRLRHGAGPAFSHREFSLGCAAILLHDGGYLKSRDDLTGTGAKYTSSHVDRSCKMTQVFLPPAGVNADELEGVMNAIRCTGLTSKIELINFKNDVERLTGCMVATSDYLGQMADPRYPEKLPGLFAEFEESNDFNQVPAEKRMFRSAKELMAKTGGFWTHFALPKLEKDFEGVYRLLEMPDGGNPYIDAVGINLARIEAMSKLAD